MRSKSTSLLAVIAVIAMAFSVGCNKGGKCDQAGEKLLVLLGEMTKDMPAEAAVEAKKELAANKSKWVEKCKAEGTDKNIDCILAAKTMADMEKCE